MLFRQFLQKGSLLLWVWEWPLGYPFKKELARKLEERAFTTAFSFRTCKTHSGIWTEAGSRWQLWTSSGHDGGWTLTVSTQCGPSKSCFSTAPPSLSFLDSVRPPTPQPQAFSSHSIASPSPPPLMGIAPWKHLAPVTLAWPVPPRRLDATYLLTSHSSHIQPRQQNPRCSFQIEAQRRECFHRSWKEVRSRIQNKAMKTLARAGSHSPP